VNVASNAPASVTNTGTVSGGGETNTSNNTASDPTTINTSGGGGSAPQSDDFNTSSLNTSLWNFVNAVGNGSFTMTGTQVSLTVPAGSNHDPSFGGTNSTAHIIQRVSNTDFTVETKFDSIPSQQYTFEGLTVEQDASNYLRMEFGSTGSTLIVQAASVLSGNTAALQSATVTGATSSLWIRVQRQGATWTVSWSTNGSTYQTLGAFTQGLTVSGIGPYVGNYNAVSPPAFTATVDYFHSM
jgi:regulation of enolase protein 1 (concanavalin A-like superfamily)